MRPRRRSAPAWVGRAAIAALLLPAPSARAAERWRTLPPTPAPLAGETTGYADVDGIRLYHAEIGSGPPVVLLHGGLANSDYWGHLAAALAPRHRLILVDSRGQGRSTRDARPFGYDLMADDVVGLLDALHVPRADLVGWSDGAILGLDLAMRHPDRVGKVFAFAANADPSGVKTGVEENPTFAAFIARARREFAALSPTPRGFDALLAGMTAMWSSQPRWTDADLARIRAAVEIADGDHDEAIERSATEHLAAAIPGAGLLILPNASHFAFLQDPALFDQAVSDFLDGR